MVLTLWKAVYSTFWLGKESPVIQTKIQKPCPKVPGLSQTNCILLPAFTTDVARTRENNFLFLSLYLPSLHTYLANRCQTFSTHAARASWPRWGYKSQMEESTYLLQSVLCPYAQSVLHKTCFFYSAFVVYDLFFPSAKNMYLKFWCNLFKFLCNNVVISGILREC